MIEIKNILKKNRKLMAFIPIFILYIILVELIMGIGMKDNKVWEKGEEWSKNNQSQKTIRSKADQDQKTLRSKDIKIKRH